MELQKLSPIAKLSNPRVESKIFLAQTFELSHNLKNLHQINTAC